MQGRWLAGASMALLLAAFAAPSVAARPAPTYSASVSVAADCTVTTVGGWKNIKVDEVRLDGYVDAVLPIDPLEVPGAVSTTLSGVKGTRASGDLSATPSTDANHDITVIASFWQTGNFVGASEDTVNVACTF